MNTLKISIIMFFSLMMLASFSFAADEVHATRLGELNCSDAKDPENKAKCEKCEQYVDIHDVTKVASGFKETEANAGPSEKENK